MKHFVVTIFVVFQVLGCATREAEIKFKTINIPQRRVKIDIPANWTYEGGVLNNEKGVKLADIPMEFEDHPVRTVAEYIAQCKNGYADDAEGTVFINADSFSINNTLWTMCTRQVIAEDGNGGSVQLFSHGYFTRIKGHCFEIIFYNKQQKQDNESLIKHILASLQSEG